MNQFLIVLYYFTMAGFQYIRNCTSHLLMVSEPYNPFDTLQRVSYLILFKNPLKLTKPPTSHYLKDLWNTIDRKYFTYNNVKYQLSKIGVPEDVGELLYKEIPLTDFRYIIIGKLYDFKSDKNYSAYMHTHYNNYNYKVYQKDDFIYVFKVHQQNCTLIQVYYIHGENLTPLVMNKLRTKPLCIIVPEDTSYGIVILTEAFCGTNFALETEYGYFDYLANLDDETLLEIIMEYIVANELLPPNYIDKSLRIVYNRTKKENEILCDVPTDYEHLTQNYNFDLNLNEILNKRSKSIRDKYPNR